MAHAWGPLAVGKWQKKEDGHPIEQWCWGYHETSTRDRAQALEVFEPTKAKQQVLKS
jgi:hypothetical protein